MKIDPHAIRQQISGRNAPTRVNGDVVLVPQPQLQLADWVCQNCEGSGEECRECAGTGRKSK